MLPPDVRGGLPAGADLAALSSFAAGFAGAADSVPSAAGVSGGSEPVAAAASAVTSGSGAVGLAVPAVSAGVGVPAFGPEAPSARWSTCVPPPVSATATPTATAAAAAVRDRTMRVRTAFFRRASTRDGVAGVRLLMPVAPHRGKGGGVRSSLGS